jgi:hypothetical protein
MGNVLTEDAIVKCAAALPPNPPAPHGGTVLVPTTAPTPLLRVNNRKVLVDAGTPWLVAPGTCGNVPPNQKKCTQVLSVADTASRLKVNGQPVVLDSSDGDTDGAPKGTLSATQPGPKLLRAE